MFYNGACKARFTTIDNRAGSFFFKGASSHNDTASFVAGRLDEIETPACEHASLTFVDLPDFRLHPFTLMG
ncbi:hypothetical protein EC845_1995 [Comamonas sp. BIGb0124]|uniref:hypothetical protein n=1 Tax=Comamonas sp. BIGb0124 TaxID=2485130 RepID=UPI000F96FC67|nr:hypothetical protein [Comamonas sp. BIGb0124]ROR23081.1 hypothetical protein EC845_1995 [Comamonas sp. BIGb0124]